MARFISMLYIDGAALDALGPEGNAKLNAEAAAFDQSLVDAGKLLIGSAIAWPRDAVTIRRRDGRQSVTDGPYAETKEHVGGFVVYEVSDRAELIDILSRDPMSPYADFEIREIKNPADPDWPEWAARAYGPR